MTHSTTDQFKIVPYVGALPIRFDMTRDDVTAILGAPKSSRTDKSGKITEQRGVVTISYDVTTATVSHIGFVPGARVFLNGNDLFAVSDVVKFLRQIDPRAYEWVGFLFFFELGLRLSGFHENDDSQKAIALFPLGRCDSDRPKMKEVQSAPKDG